jgi:hypothetical protein
VKLPREEQHTFDNRLYNTNMKYRPVDFDYVSKIIRNMI